MKGGRPVFLLCTGGRPDFQGVAMPEDTRSVREIADEIRAYGQSLFYHPVRVKARGEVVVGKKIVAACRMLGLPSVAAEFVISR